MATQTISSILTTCNARPPITTPAYVANIVGIQGVDAGGKAGQLLSKIDNTDFNTQWVDAPALTHHQLNQLIGVI
jgi:hypothetical protein